jgi:guanine deaminase
MLEDGVDVELQADRGVPNSRLDIVTAFWMATVGGAELLGIPAGLLAPGRLFDAIAVSIGPTLSPGDRSETDGWEHIFEKVVRSGGTADIDTVWVGGVDVTNHLDASGK